MSSVGYKLVVSYEGTEFCGWQKQEPPAEEFERSEREKRKDRKGLEDQGIKKRVLGRVEKDGVERVQLRTVQHVLERAVQEVLREEIALVGASRTDSGVHAYGQVAHFVSKPEVDKGVGWPADRGCDRLARAINARLPRDVWVRSAEVVPPGFNVIGGAVEKEYTYTMACGETRPVFGRRYVWHTWDDLDAVKMNEAAQALIGEHDFAGFAQINHGRKTTVRTIFRCSVEDLGKEKTPSVCCADTSPGSPGEAEDGIKYVRMRVSGSGFLYHMVRIIAGTLMEVGQGKMTVDEVRGVLESADRFKNPGPTLPPMGLRLEWIKYGD